MQYCTECHSIEQGTVEIELDNETIEVCASCQSIDDTVRHYDEDYGKER